MIINSILDTDLYKITMAQAILFGKMGGIPYESVDVEYEFINRGNHKFPKNFDIALKNEIKHMSTLQLLSDERKFLESNCTYLKRSFLDFLSGYRFNPEEVQVNQTENNLSVKIKGPWYRTVFWEVPLMAMISELFYKMSNLGQEIDIEKVYQDASNKCFRLQTSLSVFSDFGTRRRFSYEVHDNVVHGLMNGGHQAFVGTSNVHFAHKYKLTPIGTHAHEWFMAHASLFGYKMANRYALEAWSNEYTGNLGIALSDTFTSKVFFEQFTVELAKLFDGTRWDSGDPIVYARNMINHYNKLKIDTASKVIVFSDGLTVDRSIEINKWCRENYIGARFGIGTHFTNDVGVKPLNIVIKLTKCNGTPTVKLSDSPGKETGPKEEINYCKYVLGIK